MHSSSGYKRGLAGSAIAALAITGLPIFASPASADPAPPSANGAVTFISQFNDGTEASARPDGQNTTITLAAERREPGHPRRVRVQHRQPGPVGPHHHRLEHHRGRVRHRPVEPGRAARRGGLTSPSTCAPGSVRVRHAQASVQPDVTVYGSANRTENTVNLDEAQRGFFPQPYADSGETAQNVIVEGTTSAGAGDVAVS